MTRWSRAAPAVAWAVVTAAAVAALEGAGTGALSPPPVTDPGRWWEWLEAREPVVAAFALLRLAALGAAWYLAAATAVGVAARLCGARRLVAVADAVTVPPLRRLLAGTLSLGMAGLGPVGMAAAAQPAPAPSTTAPAATATGATITMHRLPPPAAPAPAPPAPAPAAGPEWTVTPGDCFWTIAEAVLQRAWARPPSDGELVPYWRALIAANRPALADRLNPDLIFPGQVFVLPAPPPAAG